MSSLSSLRCRGSQVLGMSGEDNWRCWGRHEHWERHVKSLGEDIKEDGDHTGEVRDDGEHIGDVGEDIREDQGR